MSKVVLGDLFRRVVRRGDTIWPHRHRPPYQPLAIGEETANPGGSGGSSTTTATTTPQAGAAEPVQL